MSMRIFVIIILFVNIYAKDEDEILKILNRATTIKSPKYPDYEIYDPFQYATPAIKKAKEVKIAPTPPLPKLKAIINSSAYIDGKWRVVGEDINGYRVLHIGIESVVLGLGDRNITIYVTGKTKRDKFMKIVEPKSKR